MFWGQIAFVWALLHHSLAVWPCIGDLTSLNLSCLIRKMRLTHEIFHMGLLEGSNKPIHRTVPCACVRACVRSRSRQVRLCDVGGAQWVLQWVSPPVKPWNSCSTRCHFMLLPREKVSNLGVDSSHDWLITRIWIGRAHQTWVYSSSFRKSFKK